MYNIPISTRFETIHDLYKEQKENAQNMTTFKSQPKQYMHPQYRPQQFYQKNYY
jgi:hypothetical protein